MKSINFIKEKLDELVVLFPSMKCSYEFDELDNTHTIEILPSNIYNSAEFYNVSSKIDIEFIERFPHEGLYFIDDQTLIPIKNILYSVKGHEYATTQAYSSAYPHVYISHSTNNPPKFIRIKENDINIVSKDMSVNKNTSDTSSNLDRVLIPCETISELSGGEESFAMAA